MISHDRAPFSPIAARRLAVAAIVPLTALFAVLLHIDSLKFWMFEYLCDNWTSESVRKTALVDVVAIEYQPWSGVIEDDYYPAHLAKNLLTPPREFAVVQLIYDAPRGKVGESCIGRYVISAADPTEVLMPACKDMIPVHKARVFEYVVRYSYGLSNPTGIRSFRFTVENSATGEHLVEQRSFQLLLGGMTLAENRRWYGWGSAEGARVCKLTHPKELLHRALRAG